MKVATSGSLKHCDAKVTTCAVAETARGATDGKVLELSRRERRILITEDRDFGQLVFAAGNTEVRGVLYLRCPEESRAILPRAIAALVSRLGSQIEGSFVVWTPRRVRVRSLHGS